MYKTTRTTHVSAQPVRGNTLIRLPRRTIKNPEAAYSCLAAASGYAFVCAPLTRPTGRGLPTLSRPLLRRPSGPTVRAHGSPAPGNFRSSRRARARAATADDDESNPFGLEHFPKVTDAYNTRSPPLESL